MTTAYTTPNISYYIKRMESVDGKTTSKGALGQLGAEIGLTLAGAGLQGAAYQSQAAQVPKTVALKNAYTTAMAGYTGAQLGVSRQQLGIQTTALQQKSALLGGQFTIERQQYALAQQAYPQQYAQAALTYTIKKKQLQEQGATSGAQNVTTQKKQLGTLGQEYTWQVQNIQRAQKTTQLGQQATLEKQQYTQQQIANNQKNLTLLAQSNGLSQQEVITRLNYAIANNQIQGVTSINTLMAKLGSVYSGEATQLGSQLGLGGFAGGTIGGMNVLAPLAGKG